MPCSAGTLLLPLPLPTCVFTCSIKGTDEKTNLHIEPGLFHFQMYPALLSPVLLGLARRPGASVLDLGSSPTDPAYKGLLQPADSTAACCGPVLPEGVQDCVRKATKPPVSQHGPRVFPAALGVERNHVAHEQEN